MPRYPRQWTRMTVTLEEAIELLQKKQEAEAQKHIKKFEEEPELEILNGRYGPYIAYKGSNYKIPKDIIPQDLNLQALSGNCENCKATRIRASLSGLQRR